MIELIFSLLLSAPDADKKYDYCPKRGVCKPVHAVQYNTMLIRNAMQEHMPEFTEKFTCRINMKLTRSGHLSSITALNCDERYMRQIFQIAVSASPFTILPGVYSQIKDINLTISPDLGRRKSTPSTNNDLKLCEYWMNAYFNDNTATSKANMNEVCNRVKLQ